MRLRTANRRRMRADRRDQRLVDALFRQVAFDVMDRIVGRAFDAVYGPGTADRIRARTKAPQ